MQRGQWPPGGHLAPSRQPNSGSVDPRVSARRSAESERDNTARRDARATAPLDMAVPLPASELPLTANELFSADFSGESPAEPEFANSQDSKGPSTSGRAASSNASNPRCSDPRAASRAVHSSSHPNSSSQQINAPHSNAGNRHIASLDAGARSVTSPGRDMTDETKPLYYAEQLTQYQPQATAHSAAGHSNVPPDRRRSSGESLEKPSGTKPFYNFGPSQPAEQRHGTVQSGSHRPAQQHQQTQQQKQHHHLQQPQYHQYQQQSPQQHHHLQQQQHPQQQQQTYHQQSQQDPRDYHSSYQRDAGSGSVPTNEYQQRYQQGTSAGSTPGFPASHSAAPAPPTAAPQHQGQYAASAAALSNHGDRHAAYAGESYAAASGHGRTASAVGASSASGASHPPAHQGHAQDVRGASAAVAARQQHFYSDEHMPSQPTFRQQSAPQYSRKAGVSSSSSTSSFPPQNHPIAAATSPSAAVRHTPAAPAAAPSPSAYRYSQDGMTTSADVCRAEAAAVPGYAATTSSGAQQERYDREWAHASAPAYRSDMQAELGTQARSSSSSSQQQQGYDWSRQSAVSAREVAESSDMLRDSRASTVESYGQHSSPARVSTVDNYGQRSSAVTSQRPAELHRTTVHRDPSDAARTQQAPAATYHDRRSTPAEPAHLPNSRASVPSASRYGERSSDLASHPADAGSGPSAASYLRHDPPLSLLEELVSASPSATKYGERSSDLPSHPADVRAEAAPAASAAASYSRNERPLTLLEELVSSSAASCPARPEANTGTPGDTTSGGYESESSASFYGRDWARASASSTVHPLDSRTSRGDDPASSVRTSAYTLDNERSGSEMASRLIDDRSQARSSVSGSSRAQTGEAPSADSSLPPPRDWARASSSTERHAERSSSAERVGRDSDTSVTRIHREELLRLVSAQEPDEAPGGKQAFDRLLPRASDLNAPSPQPWEDDFFSASAGTGASADHTDDGQAVSPTRRRASDGSGRHAEKELPPPQRPRSPPRAPLSPRSALRRREQQHEEYERQYRQREGRDYARPDLYQRPPPRDGELPDTAAVRFGERSRSDDRSASQKRSRPRSPVADLPDAKRRQRSPSVTRRSSEDPVRSRPTEDVSECVERVQPPKVVPAHAPGTRGRHTKTKDGRHYVPTASSMRRARGDVYSLDLAREQPWAMLFFAEPANDPPTSCSGVSSAAAMSPMPDTSSSSGETAQVTSSSGEATEATSPLDVTSSAAAAKDAQTMSDCAKPASPETIKPAASTADNGVTEDSSSHLAGENGRHDNSMAAAAPSDAVATDKGQSTDAKLTPSAEIPAVPAIVMTSDKRQAQADKLLEGTPQLCELLAEFRSIFSSPKGANVATVAAVEEPMEVEPILEEGEVSESEEEGEEASGPVDSAASIVPSPGVHAASRTNSDARVPHDGALDGSPAEIPEKDLMTPDEDGRVFAHADLWSNVPGQSDTGKLCSCSEEAQKKGVLHGVYRGEERITPCVTNSNNRARLYCYHIQLSPLKNFATSSPTTIRVEDIPYEFEGFSLISHEDLSMIPSTRLIRFNIEYTLSLSPEPMPKDFTMDCLNTFHDFLFNKLLELYDWDLMGQLEDTCPRFHVYPRFVPANTSTRDGPIPLLSMDRILKYLVDFHRPLYTPCEGVKYEGNPVEFADELVFSSYKKPSTIRLDRFEVKEGMEHPVICHFGIRPVQHSYAADPNYLKLQRSFNKYQHQQFFGQLTREDLERMVQVKYEMEQIREEKTLRRDVMVEVNADGYNHTGLKSDIAQWSLMLPVITHHVRHFISLKEFDDTLQYKFKDRSLLSLALTHPSHHVNYCMNPDHARNALSNCGVREPAYGDRRAVMPILKRRGMTKLFNTMGKQASPDSVSPVQHFERLEFLGDAVLEFVCSLHLFLLFPDAQEGLLTIFRTAMVQNTHLAYMCESLHMEDFMLYAHGPHLTDELGLKQMIANVFEALMGGIFLEEGLTAVSSFFSRHIFGDEQDLVDVWMGYPLHDLQQDKPCGDRELISETPLLKDLLQLEERTGIRFRHIRLLAKAMTHPQVGFNNLTGGHNQRLEFLGDSVLQFATSQYLYRHFPEHHEGHLSLLRSVLVNNLCLAKVTHDLGLLEYTNFGPERSKMNAKTKLLADLFEAFLAALCLDRGMKLAVEVCNTVLFPRLPDMIEKRDWIDPKSKLQQSAMTLRRHNQPSTMPTYRQLEERGPSHKKIFTVGVFFRGKRIGVGSGHSIQAAEMEAAEDALESRAIPRLRQAQFQVDDRSKAYPYWE
eukprot:scpid5641/ scgid13951/ Ribonuclease 3; Protein Drosha; Ribonuclease III